MILTGKNLGERQRELNNKVNEAFSNKVDFEHVRYEPEHSDVDRLFKIDLASKYKNLDYILETIKCGDSLYVSRALKSSWLFEDEYSHIINVDYLHNELFPYMSFKMVRKLLTIVSMHVKDEKIIEFYNYCKKQRLTQNSYKFLVRTSESFRLQNVPDVNSLIDKQMLTYYIGDSFPIATYCFENTPESEHNDMLAQFSYLYAVSADKFLDMLEKFWSDDGFELNQKAIGLRISKDIMTKHKTRLYNLPLFYLRIVRRPVLLKFSTVQDAKFYLTVLLPDSITQFWRMHFYSKYKYIFELIPFEERLIEFEKIFKKKWPNEEFRLSPHFYQNRYFDLMRIDIKEAWSLQQIERGVELSGTENDFTLYRFVRFEKAFEELKKKIKVTKKLDTRAEMLIVLVKSAKTDRDIEKVLRYFYERHINEMLHVREMFVEAVMTEHNVYKFDLPCWEAYNQLLYNLRIYEPDYHSPKSDFKIMPLIYNIINRIEIPKNISRFLESGVYFNFFRVQVGSLTKEEFEMVYEYVLSYYLNRINDIETQPSNEELKPRIRTYVHYILDLLYHFNKTIHNIPEVLENYILADIQEFQNHHLLKNELRYTDKLTQGKLYKFLKQDVSVFLANLPRLEEIFGVQMLRIRVASVLSKLKIYFNHDIAKDVLSIYEKNLCREAYYYTTANDIVYGILKLGDTDYVINFMEKFVPTETKIHFDQIDGNTLLTQQAICRFMCFTRPPLPLHYVHKYLRGDYVKFCLSIFNSYLAKLPRPACLEFVKSLIDKPVSVQKHGIRLAFQCLDVEDLKNIIVEVWTQNDNVSLRSVIYKNLYHKILKSDPDIRNALFDLLKNFTLTLRPTDDEDLISLGASDRLPYELKGEYIETLWNVVDNMPLTGTYITMREIVVKCMSKNVHLVRDAVLRDLTEKTIRNALSGLQFQEAKFVDDLTKAKWKFVAKYLTYFKNENDFNRKSAKVLNVLEDCIIRWRTVNTEVYVFRRLFEEFLNDIDVFSFENNLSSYKYMNEMYKRILDVIFKSLRIEEVYERIWFLKFSMVAKEAVMSVEPKIREFNIDLIDKCIENFSVGFAKLFKEMLDSKFYFKIVALAVTAPLELQIMNMLGDFQCWDEKKKVDTFVRIGYELTKVDDFDNYVFAMFLLPKDPDECTYIEIYKEVMKKLKDLNNKEMNIFMYRKYVEPNYTRHPFYSFNY